MAKKQEYNEESISLLKGAERVRKRPAVIFGSDGIEGCEHSFFEILSNSIDEYKEGYGKQINITVYNDHSIQIEDFGRGVPLDWNEKEGRYNWDLVYCELYAGGKYNNVMGGSYEYSLGLNGLGACATQYSSEYMSVTAYTRGIKYNINFKKGEPVTDLIKEDCPKTKSGTVVKWKPDLEVFTDIAISRTFFQKTLKKQSVVNEGLLLVLNWQNPDNTFDKEEFYYEKGIVDYVNEVIGNTAFTSPVFYSAERVGRDRADKEEYKLKMTFTFCFSNDVQLLEYYHNSSYLEHGGSPEKAVRSSFVWAIDKYLKNNNKYKSNESKITFVDVEDCLVFVSNSFSTQTSYANQTKKAITNTFIAEAMTEFFKHCLETYMLENPQEAEKISNQVLINKRSREKSEATRIDIKKKYDSKLDIRDNVEKFVNCRSKDKDICEVYIVEGDSALTSCKLARNADFQAIIPIRGKILNCLKASDNKIYESEIITDLMKVIGCGIEVKTKNKSFETFNRNALRWSKIILCTDADEDGFQIRGLLIAMFYKLLPSLLREGLIYIAQTPLYEITTKDEVFFAYDEKEKVQYLSKIGDNKYTIQRSKGLGENEPEMMSRTTMNPATRRLLQVKIEDEAKAMEIFDILVGNNIDARKDYIAEHGFKYLPTSDI
ncbi:DNA topoisomerase [Eubacteriales bacterium OttesenSCG-928-G02]|nr:DNA topoisomerase [Eubacteriales bacterium OttesenSCG-928-G02]